MLYTLSKKKMFEASGTAFTKIEGFPSLLKNGGAFQLQRRLKQLRRKSRASPTGYLNMTKHPYQEISVLVRNKYNRLLIYLTNRLHTGFIPDKELLIPDPQEGRLTLNSFWTVSDSADRMQYYDMESYRDVI